MIIVGLLFVWLVMVGTLLVAGYPPERLAVSSIAGAVGGLIGSGIVLAIQAKRRRW